jgi:hypothetical protein
VEAFTGIDQDKADQAKDEKQQSQNSKEGPESLTDDLIADHRRGDNPCGDSQVAERNECLPNRKPRGAGPEHASRIAYSRQLAHQNRAPGRYEHHNEHRYANEENKGFPKSLLSDVGENQHYDADDGEESDRVHAQHENRRSGWKIS